jgi:hypothetical protein
VEADAVNEARPRRELALAPVVVEGDDGLESSGELLLLPQLPDKGEVILGARPPERGVLRDRLALPEGRARCGRHAVCRSTSSSQTNEMNATHAVPPARPAAIVHQDRPPLAVSVSVVLLTARLVDGELDLAAGGGTAAFSLPLPLPSAAFVPPKYPSPAPRAVATE